VRSISVKGIIVRNGRVLMLEYADPFLHYNLPGGRLKEGESLEAGLKRTVGEEVQVPVEIGRLVAVAAYDPARWNGRWGDVPKLQFNFLCSADGEPSLPDVLHDDPVFPECLTWLAIDELAHAPLLPWIGPTVLAGLSAAAPWNPHCFYRLRLDGGSQ
jgi:8-oxo-dGTP diphosphatase